jgi:hypothetical protein
LTAALGIRFTKSKNEREELPEVDRLNGLKNLVGNDSCTSRVGVNFIREELRKIESGTNKSINPIRWPALAKRMSDDR